MPDPDGAKRLLDYGCKVTFQKENMLVPRRVRSPGDFRPGTKKGNKNPEFVEEFRIVAGENFNGKKMDIRIVPILDKETSIYYVSKYATDNTTSHTGFITPLIFG
jgi:hypothetical protein